MVSDDCRGCCQSRAVVSMRVQERDSGRMIDETIPSYLRSVYRVMYQNPIGRKLIKFPVTTAVLRRATARHGLKMDHPDSAGQIAKFIETYGVNVDEVELPLSSYATFNDFFARKLKPGVRPIACPDDDSVLVSPADCRLLVFPSVEDTTKLWLKGQDFTVASLLGPDFQHLLQHFHSPAVAIARLAPQDFHRWWLPSSSVVGPRSSIAGTYFSVSPRAVREVNILCTNKREVCMFDSPALGKWCMIAVGAAMVSSIKVAEGMKEGTHQQKGAEHGEFRFGGSTLILLFDSKAIAWDDDLIANSRKPVETYVKVGTRIGRSRKAALSEQQQRQEESGALYGDQTRRSAISSSPSPTSPGIVHTATTDAARKEAALNDEGLMQDFPFALQSNLTLLERDVDTVKARGVPSHTRANLDAAEAVNADTSSRRASTVESLLPSFFTGHSADDEAGSGPSSPSLSPPSLERSDSDPSSRSPLPAPAVFHLVQFTEGADEDGEDEEEEDEEMGESSHLMQDDQYQQAASASPAAARSPASSGSGSASNKKRQQQFAHASTLMPPSASAASSSATSNSASPRQSKRRSRNEAQGDNAAATSVADAASTADEEEEQPKVKKAKKRGSRK